jgi:hypothetical protein
MDRLRGPVRQSPEPSARRGWGTQANMTLEALRLAPLENYRGDHTNSARAGQGNGPGEWQTF